MGSTLCANTANYRGWPLYVGYAIGAGSIIGGLRALYGISQIASAKFELYKLSHGKHQQMSQAEREAEIAKLKDRISDGWQNIGRGIIEMCFPLISLLVFIPYDCLKARSHKLNVQENPSIVQKIPNSQNQEIPLEPLITTQNNLNQETQVKPDQNAQKVNGIPDCLQSYAQKAPGLIKMVHDFRQGHAFKQAELLAIYKETMHLLKIPNDGMSQSGDPLPFDLQETLDKIAEQLDTDPFSETMLESMGKKDQFGVVAYIEHEKGHFNTWIVNGTNFTSYPQYLEQNKKEPYQVPLGIDAKYYSSEHYELMKEQSTSEYFCSFPKKSVEKSKAVWINQPIKIYAKNCDNKTIYPGKIPNMNTCGFEAVVQILASVLPK